MMQIIFIGIAAGAASALLFASVASGSLLSIPLFYLAPLPILIAALGWSHVAALVAALVAAGCLAATLGTFFLLTFLIGVGLPAWWLGYLALLARPSADPQAQTLEWYPVGRLVFWTAILSAAVVMLALLNIGSDAESFRTGLRAAFERVLRAQTQTPADAPIRGPGGTDAQGFVDFLVLIVPPTAAVLATLTNIIALWLAGRVVKISGRLRRPWPDLAAMTFPSFAPLLLVGAIFGSFLPDMAGVMAAILAAALLMAYGLLGLAVLHALTRHFASRGFILGAIYASIAVFGWPMLLASGLGLVDSAIDLRGRAAKKRGAPPPP
jgi:magnesium-transporting ATPase (P-type)